MYLLRDLDNIVSLLVHSPSLQPSVFLSPPLHVPPFDSMIDFVLVFCLIPFPHDLEHFGINHAFHSQFTGTKK